MEVRDDLRAVVWVLQKQHSDNLFHRDIHLIYRTITVGLGGVKIIVKGLDIFIQKCETCIVQYLQVLVSSIGELFVTLGIDQTLTSTYQHWGQLLKVVRFLVQNVLRRGYILVLGSSERLVQYSIVTRS